VRDFLEVFERQPAAITRPDQRTYAGSGYDANRDAFLFQYFENSNVGHAPGKAAAERQADRGHPRLSRAAFAGQFPSKGLHGPDDLAQTLHGNPMFPAFSRLAGTSRSCY
jgi:hypothetical protein